MVHEDLKVVQGDVRHVRQVQVAPALAGKAGLKLQQKVEKDVQIAGIVQAGEGQGLVVNAAEKILAKGRHLRQELAQCQRVLLVLL